MSAEEILSLTGPAVLLNIRKGTKAPTEKGWQTLTLADMGPAYKASLRQNIGVSLGEASGGLHSIDCDDEKAFSSMLESNPQLADTLQSHGARGGNFWLRIDGEAPKSGKLKAQDGNALGEWRGTGNQTVIFGTHPSGVEYRHNGTPALTIPFSDLKWPDSWLLPWNERQKGGTHPPEGKERHGKVSPDAVRAMLASIPPRPDYATWLKVAAAVRHGTGETERAIELLKEWSPEEKNGEYAELLKSHFQEITFSSLVFLAGEYGFSGVVQRFFYNGRAYCMEGTNGFIPLQSEAPVRQHLGTLAVPAKQQAGVLCSIREQQFVEYIGPVAGLKAGLHEFNSNKFLVTRGPVIIEGKQGRERLIHNFLTSLLDDPAQVEQLSVFLDWLAHCRKAVISGKWVQTPAVALTGKRGDGKSLLIEIIKRCLGGRAAKAYRFLSGDSPFNADLIGAELLVVDDDAASRDNRARVRLAQSIKTNFFSGSFRLEGKGRDAVYCQPVQALVFAVNEDPEHLRVLPELDDSMADKINLFQTKAATLQEGMNDPESIGKRIGEALPAFLHELDQRDIAGAYDSRRRLKCFWHPSVREALVTLSPEQQLRELSLQCWSVSKETHEKGFWEGTAAALEGLLTDHGTASSNAARRLLSWPGACGTFLGRLADAGGTGVERGTKGHDKIQRYRITARVEEEAISESFRE